MSDAVTQDRFLNGRITVAQPKNGFRAGHDSVLLAAAVPAEPRSRILELGSGVGVASLCLAARVPDVVILGIEIDRDLVQIANENAARNNLSDRISFVVGDATTDFDLSAPESASPLRGGRSAVAMRGASGGRLDHVFFNPPFHPDSAHRSPIAARDRSMRDSTDAVGAWTGRALSLVKDAGTVTAIIRADRVDDILDRAADYRVVVFPLLPRVGLTAKRALVRIVKVSDRNVLHMSGLVLHEADGRNTEAAEAILRHGQALNLAP